MQLCILHSESSVRRPPYRIPEGSHLLSWARTPCAGRSEDPRDAPSNFHNRDLPWQEVGDPEMHRPPGSESEMEAELQLPLGGLAKEGAQRAGKALERDAALSRKKEHRPADRWKVPPGPYF